MKNSDFINDLFEAFNNSYRAKDDSRLDIACRKSKYEENLNEMWNIYRTNPRQIVEYNKQLNMIKECGCKVMRNSSGKHKIVI